MEARAFFLEDGMVGSPNPKLEGVYIDICLDLSSLNPSYTWVT